MSDSMVNTTISFNRSYLTIIILADLTFQYCTLVLAFFTHDYRFGLLHYIIFDLYKTISRISHQRLDRLLDSSEIV